MMHGRWCLPLARARTSSQSRGLPIFTTALIAAGFCNACATEIQAPGAVVDVETGQLYGAALAGRWIAADALPAKALEGFAFTLYAKDGRRGVETLLGRVPREETCSNPTYRPLSSAVVDKGTYLSANWEATPRKAMNLGRNNPTYQEALTAWLATRGIVDSTPIIQQLVRVDLEGDGSDEIILAAERRRGSITSTKAGDYAVLLLRRLHEGQVETIPLRTDLYRKDCIAECAPNRYRLFAALDLNGDGRLELIVRRQDYESIGHTIHSLPDLKRSRLQWHCGP